MIRLFITLLIVIFPVACGTEAKLPPRPDSTIEAPVDNLRSYASIVQLQAMLDGIVKCEPAGPPSAAVFASRTQFCYYVAQDGVRDGMRLAFFDNSEATIDGAEWLAHVNPGASVVYGANWAVKTDSYYAPLIVKKLGGRLL